VRVRPKTTIATHCNLQQYLSVGKSPRLLDPASANKHRPSILPGLKSSNDRRCLFSKDGQSWISVFSFEVGDRSSSPRLRAIRYITCVAPAVTDFLTRLIPFSSLLRLLSYPSFAQRWRIRKRPVKVCNRLLRRSKTLGWFPTSKLRQATKSLSTTRRMSKLPHPEHHHQTSSELCPTEVFKHGCKLSQDLRCSSIRGVRKPHITISITSEN
jgi:hypothetical protein